jgi:predicted ArsR family transcriptional regulator
VSVKENLTCDQQEEIVERVAQRMVAAAHTPIPTSPRQQIEHAVAVMNQHGHTAQWEPDPDDEGRYRVHMVRCPYHKLAQTYAAPCKIDFRLMTLLLPNAQIERPVTEAHQGGMCTYTVAFVVQRDD